MRAFLSKQLYSIIFIAGCSLLFLAVAGYRPYPSIDDFAYIPFLLKAIDPTLFKGDFALEGVLTGSHLLLLGKIPFFEQLLPWLYLIMTASLSLVTGTIAFLFLRQLGGRGNLLPLLLFGTAGTILVGMGRGAFDGLFGRGFHPQWIALLQVLLSYLLLIRKNDKLCGIVLACGFYFHYIVAIHAVLLVFFGLIFESLLLKKYNWQRYRNIFGLTLLLGLPGFFIVGSHFSRAIALSSSLPGTIFEDIFLFRYPHEFYEILTWKQYLVGAWLLCVAVAAVITIYPKLKNELAVLAGLIIGHGFLVACYILSARVFSASLPWWIHMFYFSRTTPLLVFLLNLLIVVAIEHSFPRLQKTTTASVGNRAQSSELIGFILLVSYVFLCLLGGEVNRVFLFLPLLLLFYPLICQKLEFNALKKGCIGILLLVALTGMAFQPIEAPVEKEEGQLFSWCQDHTDKEDLFIIPPTFYKFRIFAKRPIYCSFRPILYYSFEARNRLIQICHPDKRALDKGWYAVDQWERSYLRRNPPERIASLLTETNASYWVMDHQAQKIPPFYPVVTHEQTQRLKIAFQNSRFTVYSLNLEKPA